VYITLSWERHAASFGLPAPGLIFSSESSAEGYTGGLANCRGDECLFDKEKQIVSTAPGATPNLSEQILFARHNFDNLQAMIRFSDTKAAALLTVLIFLGASGLSFARDGMQRLAWLSSASFLVSSLFVASGAAFLLAFFGSLGSVQSVLKPRTGPPGAASGRQRLMWQDHVLDHRSAQAYFAAVSGASNALILENLTDQVFELATISKGKMDALKDATWLVWWAFVAWVGLVVTSLLLLMWK